MSSRSPSENFRRILGRVVRHDFVGRASELDRIEAHAEPTNAGHLANDLCRRQHATPVQRQQRRNKLLDQLADLACKRIDALGQFAAAADELASNHHHPTASLHPSQALL